MKKARQPPVGGMEGTARASAEASMHLWSLDFRGIAEEIGKVIAKLHDNGMVHGDLTTSNMMILTEKNEMVLSLICIAPRRRPHVHNMFLVLNLPGIH